MFPHRFNTKFETLRNFKVIIKQEPLERIHLYTKLSSKEVGWLMLVTRELDTYTIHETFLPEQVVSHTETDMSAEGITKVAMELVNAGRADIVEHLRGWGHSHNTMGTTPSGQDNKEMAEFAKETQWMLRMITNKDGRIECTLLDMVEGILVTDVPWDTNSVSLNLEDQVRTELKLKVSERAYNTVTYTGQQGVGFTKPNLMNGNGDKTQTFEKDKPNGDITVTHFHKDGTKTIEVITGNKNGNGIKTGYIEPCKKCNKYTCDHSIAEQTGMSQKEIENLSPQDLADYYSMMEY